MADRKAVVVCAADIPLRTTSCVSVDETHVTINVAYEYHIPLSDCKTAERLLGWVLHLSEKTWMTNEAMHDFVLKVSHANNITIKR